MYTITSYTKNRAKQAGLQVMPSKKKGKKIDVFQKWKVPSFNRRYSL